MCCMNAIIHKLLLGSPVTCHSSCRADMGQFFVLVLNRGSPVTCHSSCRADMGQFFRTWDVAFRILENINSVKNRAMLDVHDDNLLEETKIYICDINPNMLNVGKKRAEERGFGDNKSLIWLEGDAEALKFEDDSMDGYTIAFGIRNVTHIEKALAEAYRVLKRGGRILCLELSHVELPVFKELYDYYSFSVIPALGELVAGDRESYQYLVESIRRFPSQEKFASMIAEARFQKVEYENLVGGVVAIHSGVKF
ncbi:2-methoxy-6-polyprenyl-1,4-benzoquinol methylase, mitochondrial isoform X2 [Olea europaea var. sylvestris]|uniref:2-methoxy-6-polyprenyl-1,4-benzoquinol methylase, mitochondrial isoform X2 n=1 Tax=Olea europaea var. sylvestris TaxID=158386 RepID=UPI000C1D8A34|nr:2-methoxy-6-polyprenyl-1,4-benzoquinol methylase, mitochondrial isoform X2 [Olea europaea var. sylvestris]